MSEALPWEAESWFRRYREIIPAYPAFEEALRRPLPVHVRANGLLIPTGHLVSLLALRGIALQPSHPVHEDLFTLPGDIQPGTLPEYALGFLHTQALSSCLAATILRPREGERVLDMCAAPGGKTAHLARFMNNRGVLVANEVNPRRRPALGNTLDRLGVLNAVMTGYPAQEFPLRQRFDKILVDVPCSGEGVYRGFKTPYRVFPAHAYGRLLALQRRIVLRAFDLLTPGGELLYATCTYAPAENEGVLHVLLSERDATLLPVRPSVPCAPGIGTWEKETYDARVHGAVRLYPHLGDSIGFFMARVGRA